MGWRQPHNYRRRFTPDEYLKHRQDWLEVNSYGVNPETGAWEAYQTGVFSNRPGYFAPPDRLPANVSLESWRGYTVNEAGESDRSIWGRRLNFQGNIYDNFLADRTIDWADHVYRVGLNQDYNISVSGASEQANYYLSLGYLNNQGARKDDDYRAVRANMKVDLKVTNWFEVGANVNFQDRTDGNIEMDLDHMFRSSPYADFEDANGNPVQFPNSEQWSQRGYNWYYDKQYLELERGYTVINSILTARVKLPFNITYSFNASPRMQRFYDRYFMSAELPGSNPRNRGVNREQVFRYDWSLNNIITWDHTFAHKHHFVLTLVQEAEARSSWLDRIEARNIQPSDALGFHNTRNGSKEDSNFRSSDARETADALLARLFYSYDNKYMITTSIRRDGYSAFGSSNPHAFFPSVAVAWAFANEDFFAWNDILSSGRLRVSYGRNGNRSLENPYMALASLYEGAGRTMGYIDQQGNMVQYRYLMAERMANLNLQWEKTTSWNIGLDFGLFNERLTGNIEYYNMSTNDMIMNQPLPRLTGFNNITTNLGQVDNKGVEITMRSANIRNDNFEWYTSVGFSYNKNEIVSLFGEYEDILDADGNVIGRREMDYSQSNWFIGQPINVIYGHRVTGIWQANEVEEAARYQRVPGDIKVANSYTADDRVNADGTVTPVYNQFDQEILGITTAPYHWSIRNEFVLWKDFTISFNIYSFMGHKQARGGFRNQDDDGGRLTFAAANMLYKEHWTPENPSNRYGRIDARGPTGAERPNQIYNRSFVRFDNFSLGYTLPGDWTSRVDVERARVFASVRNVAVWSAKEWTYGDPETDGLAPIIFTLGLNLVF